MSWQNAAFKTFKALTSTVMLYWCAVMTAPVPRGRLQHLGKYIIKVRSWWNGNMSSAICWLFRQTKCSLSIKSNSDWQLRGSSSLQHTSFDLLAETGVMRGQLFNYYLTQQDHCEQHSVLPKPIPSLFLFPILSIPFNHISTYCCPYSVGSLGTSHARILWEKIRG